MFTPVVEVLSHGLKQWLSTWWEGRANPGELRCKQCTWVTGRSEARIHPFPRPPVRVGSGGKGILLQIPVYQKLSKGKQTFFSLYFCVCSCCIWAYSHLLQSRTLLPCYHYCAFHHIIVLQYPSKMVGNKMQVQQPHWLYLYRAGDLQSTNCLLWAWLLCTTTAVHGQPEKDIYSFSFINDKLVEEINELSCIQMVLLSLARLLLSPANS